MIFLVNNIFPTLTLKYRRGRNITMNYDNRYKQLGLKIAYYRKLKGYTQEEFAEKLNVSVSYIGQIEAPNIYKAISLKTLFKIADALEIAPYKLLKDD